MDANTTAAVDILIRTSMGQAANDFNRILARMEADARAFAERLKNILGGINFSSIGGTARSFTGGGTNARGSIPLGGTGDALKDMATADIARMQAQRLTMERELTKQLNKENTTQESDRVKAFKRSMNEIANSLRTNEAQFKTMGSRASNAFNSAFAGTFLGLSAQQGVVYGIRKLGEFIGDIFNQSLNFSNAVTALAQFEGSVDKAQDKVKELIKVANATPGLRFESAVQGQQKLEAVGFESEKATKLLAGLAKIRIMSGTSQQDYDIMITELAKFSQGGEQAGRIFRELANHMGALIPLIKSHFGNLSEETIKAAGGPKKFLESLIAILDQVNPKFNDTTLAVENISDAYLRWKISLGGIIEKNPDLVAAINVTTNSINHQTDALNSNESVARKNAENWVSRLARLIISAQNFGDKVIAVMTDAGTVIGDLINVMSASWIDGLHALGAGFDLLLINPLNKAIDAINSLKGALSSIPGLGGLGQVSEIPRIGYFTGDPSQPGFMNQDFRSASKTAISRYRTDSSYGNSAYAQADTAAKQRWADFEAERLRVIASRSAPLPAWDKGSDVDNNDLGGKGKARFSEDLQGAQKDAAISGFQAALAKLDPAMRNQIMDAAARWGIPSAIALAQIFQESTFKAGAVSNQGAYGLTQVQPATGNRALAFQGIGTTVTGASLKNPSTALLAWGAEMNRLYQKYGDWNIVALAYHGGEKTADAYLRAAEGGRAALQAFAHGNPKSFQYVQLLRARSGLGAGASDLSGLSDTLTKEQQEARDRRYIELLGISPSLLNAGGQSKEADAVLKRASESLARQRGIAQPQDRAGMLALLGLTAPQAGALTTTPITNIGAGFHVRPGPAQQYTQDVAKQLGTEQRITDLVIRRSQVDAEIAERHKSYMISLEEESTENKVQLELVKARQPILEAQDELEKRRVQYVSESKDAERELLALQSENADQSLVALRQANIVSRDRYALEKEISDLGDAMATSNSTSNLRIQRDLLKDIVDLREEEVTAVSESNKAVLEITRQTQYSATRANAEVLKYMASQKGVTEAMGDFKIGLIESGYDLIDRGLDKVIPKMGKFSDTIHELLSSMLRLAANWAFRKLFGIDTSIQGAQTGTASAAAGGGGFLSMIQRMFLGGGGSSTGAGSGGGVLSGIDPNNPYIMHLGSAGGFNPMMQVGGGAGQFNFPSLSKLFTGGGLQNVPDVSGAPTVVGAAAGHALPQGAIAQAGGISGLFKSKAFQNQLAGALAGGGLGVGLGGSSVTGQVLGGVGGAIGGTLLTGLITSGSIGGATTGGIFGSTAGLFGLSGAATFGIGLAIAGALLLGSWLFGNSAKKKAEKKQVTSLSGDALTQIQQLIDNVKHFKTDGASAYQQGVQIRDQYAQQIGQLTTSAGKKLGQQKLAEINQLLAQLKTEGDKADSQAKFAQALDERVVPTFATGGTGSAFTGYGAFGGVQLVGVHSNEAIINASQIMALGGYQRMNQIGVRGINLSGAPERSWNPRPSVAPTADQNNTPVYNAFFLDEGAADKWMDKVSPKGVATKMRVAVHTEDDAGFMAVAENKLAGK